MIGWTFTLCVPVGTQTPYPPDSAMSNDKRRNATGKVPSAARNLEALGAIFERARLGHLVLFRFLWMPFTVPALARRMHEQLGEHTT